MTSDDTFHYTYDAEGNTLSNVRISNDPADDKTVECAGDHGNRLTSVSLKSNAGTLAQKVEHAYDAFDPLIGRAVDVDGDTAIDETQRLIYDGQHVALLMADNGDGQNRYLHGAAIDMVLADERATGDILWTLIDNPRASPQGVCPRIGLDPQHIVAVRSLATQPVVVLSNTQTGS